MNAWTTYIPVLVMLAISTVFVTVFAVVIPWAARAARLRIQAPNLEKTSTYECGVEPDTSARSRYSVHFYMVAIVFILFDLEAVFLYPWASQYRALVREHGIIILLQAVVFIAILFAGFFYVLHKRVLEWSHQATTDEQKKKLLARDPRYVEIEPPAVHAAAAQPQEAR